MKKVLTLHPADLDAACALLAGDIAPFRPKVVVGILTGGGEVGRRVASHLPGVRYHEVELRRETTKRKRRAERLLRALPTWLADALRRYESRRAAGKPTRLRDVALPDSLAADLRQTAEGEGVLIVDDAVDSGGTLLSVVKSVREAAPKAEIRTSALTVTTQHPAITPDYSLRRGDTLMRFPWSLDYRPTRPSAGLHPNVGLHHGAAACCAKPTTDVSAAPWSSPTLHSSTLHSSTLHSNTSHDPALRSAAVVDLDGTLVRGNTWRHFARLVIRTALRRLHLPTAMLLASMLLLRKLRLVSHRRLKHCFMLRSHKLLSESDMERFAEAMAALFNPEVEAMLRRERSEGSMIVLATAAAGEYAPLIAQRACIGHTLCTPVAARGVRYVECRGERKADAVEDFVRERGVSVSVVITDHPDDLPLFRRFPEARHVLVK